MRGVAFPVTLMSWSAGLLKTMQTIAGPSSSATEYSSSSKLIVIAVEKRNNFLISFFHFLHGWMPKQVKQWISRYIPSSSLISTVARSKGPRLASSEGLDRRTLKDSVCSAVVSSVVGTITVTDLWPLGMVTILVMAV